MNSPTSQVVEQAIAKQDAEEAGIVVDDSKKTDDAAKGKADDKTTDQKKDDAKDAATDKSAADKDAKDTGDEKDTKDEEEGEFTADDALEVEDKPQTPQAPTDNAGIQLSPQEQKYIADNIGEPIIIRGWRGSGDNAKEVEIKAYSPADIPADFKFANDQQLVAAQTGFTNLERKATELLGSYRQNQSNAAAQDFERRENEGIRTDVADLQKDGRFPKFKVQPGQPGFDDDPAAKQMSEVLAVMTERNELYLKQYEQGRPYKHIGFSEAFDIWEAKNPERQAAKKADEDQKAEDKERKTKGAERGESNRGMSPANLVKPTVRPGTSTRDLLAAIDSME